MTLSRQLSTALKDNLALLKPRVKPYILNVLEMEDLTTIGIYPETMDIVIEDGPHNLPSQEQMLSKLFPLVKPGGNYIIEDVGWKQRGLTGFHDVPNTLTNETRVIMENHDTIWVDTAVGHRAITYATTRIV